MSSLLPESEAQSGCPRRADGLLCRAAAVCRRPVAVELIKQRRQGRESAEGKP